MKERRGAARRVTGMAEGVAAATRRRQRRRGPRVVLYDAAGQPRVLPAEAPGFQHLVETAERLIRTAGARPP